MTETTPELFRLSAAALAAKLAAREVTAVEVVQAHLDRIAAVDGQVAPGGEVPATKRMLVIRGASWNGRPTFARAASRIPLVRNSRAHVTSFRLVRSV